jgi:hypothetical protein
MILSVALVFKHKHPIEKKKKEKRRREKRRRENNTKTAPSDNKSDEKIFEASLFDLIKKQGEVQDELLKLVGQLHTRGLHVHVPPDVETRT